MSHYRIRREGLEFPVAGREALLRMVDEGTLGPGDKVFDPDSQDWVRATDLPLLGPAFQARAQKQAARRSHRPRPRPSLMGQPGQGPTGPVLPPTPTAGEHTPFQVPSDLESHSEEYSDPGNRLHSVIAGGNLRGGQQANENEDIESPTDPNLGPKKPPTPEPSDDDPSGAHVIAFSPPGAQPKPQPQPQPLPPFGASLDPEQAQAALVDPAAFLRGSHRPPADHSKPRVRPALLLMSVIVGVIGSFLWIFHIQHNSNMQYARVSTVSGGHDIAVETAPPTEPGSPRHSPSTDEVFDKIELALRNRMVPGCSTINHDDDLDTALHIELSRLGVHATAIHAPVLEWGGRRGDVPTAVEIKIWYEGRGELDRELGAIGLVVGKYAQHYSLDVRTFEVRVVTSSGTTGKRLLDATAARQLYLRRISLLEFLTSDA